MSATKEKILHTIELMSDDDAVMVLEWLNSNFVVSKKKSWDDIEEVTPDETDLEMLVEVGTNPDCKEFLSKDELLARRMARTQVQN